MKTELEVSINDIMESLEEPSSYYNLIQDFITETQRITTLSFKKHVNVSSIRITISKPEEGFEVLEGQSNVFVLEPSGSREFYYKHNLSMDWEIVTFNFNTNNLTIIENYSSGGVSYSAPIAVALFGEDFISQHQMQLQLSNTLVPIVSKKHNQ
jgi:hypothetical protein